jgi:hypothetical protein
MADIQRYFEQFHQMIRADYKTDSTLRERREGILQLLRDRLSEEKRPSFRKLLQGSYRMRTGVKPVEDLEYDIDVGLRFEVPPDEKASSVRSWVYEAVKNRTQTVEEKSSCIRVGYAAGYHVDLVIYRTSKTASGKENFELGCKDDWRPANPRELLQHFKSGLKTFEGAADSLTGTNQLRRIVRYLKRWGDEAIPRESGDKPSGLAYTLLVISQVAPAVTADGNPDDLQVLELLCRKLDQPERISAFKPTPEYEDVFGGLSDAAMGALKVRFRAMQTALISAKSDADPVSACETLHKVFGRDFPVPKPEDTAKKTKAPAIVPGSSAA